MEQTAETYLTEGSTLSHNDMEFTLSCCIFQEGLYGARTSDSHDDLIRMDVLQSLHGNIVCGSLCKTSE